VVTYVFPEKNVYTVRINGMPKIADSFNPFALTYDIRVVREVPMSGEQAVSATKGFVGRHIAHGIVVGLAFVVVFGLYVKDRLAGMNNNQKVR
jgi:tetrahydromethanopterin S-methyltransferase subunit B